MAIIHRTTMHPGKLDLLTSWLPAQPWYRSTGQAPKTTRAGGFRLDDPEGEVGIEFMVVADESGDLPIAYHVPLTYRGAPLDGAEAGLIGTSEHGVLGRRWVYDGAHDPVLVAQLLALFQGRAEAQAQSESDTPDRTVTVAFDGPELADLLPSRRPEVSHGERGTGIAVPGVTGGVGQPALVVTRVLRRREPEEGASAEDRVLGRVTAGWTAPDGTARQGVFATLYTAAAHAHAHDAV